MKVLHVLEAALGGTRRYLNDIADARLDDEMGLVYSPLRADSQFGLLLPRLRAAGWKTFEVPMTRSISAKADFQCALMLRAAMSKFLPDVVHAHSSKAGGLARIVAPTLRKRPPVVYSPHSISSSLGAAYRGIETLLSHSTARYVAVSESERSQLEALGLAKRSSIDVVPPAIDPARFAESELSKCQAQNSSKARFVVVGIGRLCEQKNPLEFFSIVRALRATIPELEVRWLGDGELRSALQREIDRGGASSWFSILGWVADVRPYLLDANLFLSTSTYESFGYATAEALASCVPVVGSNVTGTRDILQGTLSQWTYEPGKIEEAVGLCLSVFADEGVATQLARKGRDSVLSRFDLVTMRADLSMSYRKAIAGRIATG